MSYYPQQRMNPGQILALSFQQYGRLFHALFPLVLVSAFIHVIYPLAFMINKTIGNVVLVGVVLITWYLYAAILTLAHHVLMGEKPHLREGLNLAKRRYLFILGGNVVFAIIGLCLGLIFYAFFSFGDTYDMHVVFLPIAVIISVFVLVLFYFAVPLIVLEHNKIFMGFDRSMKMIWGNWWRTFFALLLMFVVILVLALIGFALTSVDSLFVNMVYNFLSQLVLFPFVVAITLFLLNDLKLRMGAH